MRPHINAYTAALLIYQPDKLSCKGAGLETNLDGRGARFAHKSQPEIPPTVS